MTSERIVCGRRRISKACKEFDFPGTARTVWRAWIEALAVVFGAGVQGGPVPAQTLDDSEGQGKLRG